MLLCPTRISSHFVPSNPQPSTPQLGLRKKGKSKLEKRQTKRQSNGFSRKYRTFYVNVLQGGNTLVRWVKYLSVGDKNLSVGAENLSVGSPFCCLFSPGIFKKRLGLFSGGLPSTTQRPLRLLLTFGVTHIVIAHLLRMSSTLFRVLSFLSLPTTFGGSLVIWVALLDLVGSSAAEDTDWLLSTRTSITDTVFDAWASSSTTSLLPKPNPPVCFTDGAVKDAKKISMLYGNFSTFYTLDTLDYFGVSIAALGDVNGDGVGDLAVGSYRDDDGGTD